MPSNDHPYHLAAAQVEGLAKVALGDAEDALNAVVDKRKAAGLLTVTPHLKLLFRSEDLAAKGSRGLLTATLPRAVGAVDVVEAGDAALHAKVLVVVLGQLFAGKLLQAVRILRLPMYGW